MILININEKDVFELFPNIFDKYIEKKIYEIINSLGIECSDYGTVISVVYGSEETVISATVRMSDDSSIESLPNHSGVMLEPGDTVKIYGSRTNMANRYIGIKCNRE